MLENTPNAVCNFLFLIMEQDWNFFSVYHHDLQAYSGRAELYQEPDFLG